jgi:hypothetical protein
LKTVDDNSLDMVIGIDIFEHMTKQDLFDNLRQIFRVLGHEGVLLIHVPNATSPFFGRVYFGDFTHELAFTKSSIGQLLRTVGFNGVTCKEESPIVHGPISLIRWLLWKIIRTFYRILLMAETGITNEVFSSNLLVLAKK